LSIFIWSIILKILTIVTIERRHAQYDVMLNELGFADPVAENRRVFV
jgi:hypothetical protein